MDGVYLDETNNILITNTTAIHNNIDGLGLFRTNNIQITNTTTTHNLQYGLSVFENINTFNEKNNSNIQWKA